VRQPASATTVSIVLFVLGLSCASLQSGFSKLLVSELSPLFVVWGRFAGFLVIVLVIVLWRHGRVGLRPPQPVLQGLRALLLVAASVAFIAAIRAMPLADAIAIVFVYPFIVTASAPLVLGERVPLSSWIAVATGFVGVLVVVRPGFGDTDWHALLALAAGTCFGAHLLVTRQLRTSAPPLVTATSTAFIGTLVLSATLPFVWQPLAMNQVLLMVLVGVFGAASQLLAIIACGKAEMSVLAPFGYTEIISATLVGFVMFGDFPDWVAWAGIAVIVASGICIAYGQRRTRVPLISRTRPPAS
jgi:drug/metabolite transporter (DMT)-like permease